LKVTILSPKNGVYDGDAKSVQLTGDEAEFEILDHHAPIVSLLRPGVVTIDGARRVLIRRGMVRFDNNECVILTE
jgi:F-type H+-transporting ATPase subunit epsilon